MLYPGNGYIVWARIVRGKYGSGIINRKLLLKIPGLFCSGITP
jgi:hypothetical protein